MILLSTDWTTAWLMAGMSVGVVFLILVLLVLVLQVFSMVAARSPQTEHEDVAADEAAVATAVYLYLSSHHDEESGLLTIHVNEHSGWHEELNDRL